MARYPIWQECKLCKRVPKVTCMVNSVYVSCRTRRLPVTSFQRVVHAQRLKRTDRVCRRCIENHIPDYCIRKPEDDYQGEVISELFDIFEPSSPETHASKTLISEPPTQLPNLQESIILNPKAYAPLDDLIRLYPHAMEILGCEWVHGVIREAHSILATHMNGWKT